MLQPFAAGDVVGQLIVLFCPVGCRHLNEPKGNGIGDSSNSRVTVTAAAMAATVPRVAHVPNTR